MSEIPNTAGSGAVLPPLPRPRIRLPVVLFFLTVMSTFLTGAAQFLPFGPLGSSYETGSLQPLRQIILANWGDGLTYSIALLSILFCHEMGHYLATVLYRIPASLPYFLPMPISPPGTFGAVIGMDGRRADRIQIFDIGLAGPLAGLIIAVPVMWAGVAQLDQSYEALGGFKLDAPLLVRWMMAGADKEVGAVAVGHLRHNPLFLAGWVGLLITGLNMMPVSQLDGGHVIHSIFGRKSRWIARGFIVFVIAYMLIQWRFQFGIMLILVLFMGPDHPPSRNDDMDIGWFRRVLGIASLAIPILCFPPNAIQLV